MDEIQRRRTFAIISHPDAGKTTLTEKFLLFGGQIQVAGAVKSNKIRKTATSDWMEIEKQRGISVTTSVMEFDYNGYKVNILDTPGHQDFAEDTYRTLTAVDSAIIVVDSAKGVEAQTRKLMNVCRMRRTPVIIFINKMDREGKDPFSLLDELEEELQISVRPLSWPIEQGARFKGVYNIYEHNLNLFAPDKQKVTAKVEVDVNSTDLEAHVGEKNAAKLRSDIELIDGVYPAFDRDTYLAGDVAPVFFGSALNNNTSNRKKCRAERTEIYRVYFQDNGKYRPQPPFLHSILQSMQWQIRKEYSVSACASRKDSEILFSRSIHGAAEKHDRRSIRRRHCRPSR